MFPPPRRPSKSKKPKPPLLGLARSGVCTEAGVVKLITLQENIADPRETTSDSDALQSTGRDVEEKKKEGDQLEDQKEEEEKENDDNREDEVNEEKLDGSDPQEKDYKENVTKEHSALVDGNRLVLQGPSEQLLSSQPHLPSLETPLSPPPRPASRKPPPPNLSNLAAIGLGLPSHTSQSRDATGMGDIPQPPPPRPPRPRPSPSIHTVTTENMGAGEVCVAKTLLALPDADTGFQVESSVVDEVDKQRDAGEIQFSEVNFATVRKSGSETHDFADSFIEELVPVPAAFPSVEIGTKATLIDMPYDREILTKNREDIEKQAQQQWQGSEQPDVLQDQIHVEENLHVHDKSTNSSSDVASTSITTPAAVVSNLQIGHEESPEVSPLSDQHNSSLVPLRAKDKISKSVEGSDGISFMKKVKGKLSDMFSKRTSSTPVNGSNSNNNTSVVEASSLLSTTICTSATDSSLNNNIHLARNSSVEIDSSKAVPYNRSSLASLSDADRIAIMQMVKEGKLTVDEALAKAEASAAAMATTSASSFGTGTSSSAPSSSSSVPSNFLTFDSSTSLANLSDEERLAILLMVKEGRLSVDEALAKAKSDAAEKGTGVTNSSDQAASLPLSSRPFSPGAESSNSIGSDRLQSSGVLFSSTFEHSSISTESLLPDSSTPGLSSVTEEKGENGLPTVTPRPRPRPRVTEQAAVVKFLFVIYLFSWAYEEIVSFVLVLSSIFSAPLFYCIC